MWSFFACNLFNDVFCLAFFSGFCCTLAVVMQILQLNDGQVAVVDLCGFCSEHTLKCEENLNIAGYEAFL